MTGSPYLLILYTLFIQSWCNQQIIVFLPSPDGQYPEQDLECITEKVITAVNGTKDIDVQTFKFEEEAKDSSTHKNDVVILRKIVMGNVTDKIFGCINLGHEKVALEMVTFLNIPSVTLSSPLLLELDTNDKNVRLPINPRFEASLKSVFNVLQLLSWSTISVLFSVHPAYAELKIHFKNISEEVRDSDDFKLNLNIKNSTDYNYTSSNTEALVSDIFKTANIIVLIGGTCDIHTFLNHSYNLELLNEKTAVIYMDVYGMLNEAPTHHGSTPDFGTCSYTGAVSQDQEVVKKAWKYVIYISSSWIDLNGVTGKRDEFRRKYDLTCPKRKNALELLLWDGVNVLLEWSDKRTNTSDFFTFATQTLEYDPWSGAIHTDDNKTRNLKVGVNIYHGNGDVLFLRWKNCPAKFCPEVTNVTSKEPPWVLGVRPTATVDKEDNTTLTLKICLSIIAVTFSTFVITVTAYHYYKKNRIGRSIHIWKLTDDEFKNIVPVESSTRNANTAKHYTNISLLTGTYKNFGVFIKQVSNFNVNMEMDYQLCMDLVHHINIKHPNVNNLLGLRVARSEVQIVQPWCSKGSLKDLIQTNPLNINDDLEYKLFILKNVADGMAYLHDEANVVHGYLKSSNCVVDGRWVVKISDFLPVRIREVYKENPEYNQDEDLLWTAPELLSSWFGRKKKMLRQADVYSYSIICYEVLARAAPYSDDLSEPESYSRIIDRVKKHTQPPYRPMLKISHCGNHEELFNLIKSCWDEDTLVRPSFRHVLEVLESLSGSQDFGDYIATQMERYSRDLDQQIREMEEALTDERLEFENLLRNMLPRQIVKAIKAGRQPPFETSDVSLYFSDIYNFDRICKHFENYPTQIVDFLHKLYNTLDTLVAYFGEKLYKVETINDSYLVMSGLPIRQDNDYQHASVIANFALYVLTIANEMKLDGVDKIKIRIGIHSGHVAAGVIGKLNPRYCLFGDTVNFTSRLESTGKPFTIHTSEDTVKLLKTRNDLFHIVPRNGMVELKNRGRHQTYFVVGMEGYEFELPKATRNLAAHGDVDSSESTSESGRSKRPSRNRNISTSSTTTDISLADTGISSALDHSEPSKKLSSCDKTEIERSVRNCLLMIDKMKNPNDSGVDEVIHRRAISAPSGGTLANHDIAQQRVSTPWRKESHESLFRRNKEGRISIGLDDTPETDEPNTAIYVDDRDPLSLHLSADGTLRNYSGMVFPDIYNHKIEESGSDNNGSRRKFSTVEEVSEGNSVTPTDSIKRKDSRNNVNKNDNQLNDRLEQLETMSSLKHLENTAMGKKRPVRISQF